MFIKNKVKLNIIAFSVFLALSLSGCGKAASHYFIRRGYIPPVHKVAMMPFENISGERTAGKAVDSIFFTELCNTQLFDLIEGGEVDKFLIEEKIRATSTIDLKTARKMAEKLGVEAIFLGAVSEYNTVNVESEQIPVVGISVRMLDANSGQILWSASHSRIGNDRETVFGFGKVKSLSNLALIVTKDLTKSLKENFSKVYIDIDKEINSDEDLSTYAFLSDIGESADLSDIEYEDMGLLEQETAKEEAVKIQDKVERIEQKTGKVDSMIDEFENLLDKYQGGK